MKLFISPASPFVRKCRIIVREKGLGQQVTEVDTVPYDNPADLLQVNPIAQIPALVRDDGVALTDSLLIGAWLDHVGQGDALIPHVSEGDAHWRVRRHEMLGHGVLDLCVKCVLERRRPVSEQSPSHIERWKSGILRALDVAETLAAKGELKAAPLTMGNLTVGVALTYLDFRLPDFVWKDSRPALVALQAEIETRPSFAETAPR
ncbi:MAG: glutathione S-transferase N-terminal domain-containing protein [Asticcacaulis sp.]